MPDIALASLSEIIDQLEKRFDDFVLYGRKVVNAEEKSYAYRGAHQGTYESVIFLLRHAEYVLHKDYQDSEREPEPWEDF